MTNYDDDRRIYISKACVEFISLNFNLIKFNLIFSPCQSCWKKIDLKKSFFSLLIVREGKKIEVERKPHKVTTTMSQKKDYFFFLF